MRERWMKWLFVVAGVYDVVIGVSFLLAPRHFFRVFHVTPPNEMSYIQFPALLLLVFAAMFFRITSDPVRYRDLIPYGIGLKVSYCILAFTYQITRSIPLMWIIPAWFDVAFIVLFVIAWSQTGRGERQLSAPTSRLGR